MAATNSTCPAAMKVTSNGAFQHENPLDFALPLLILQICLVVAFTRFLAFLCRPLRQPRVIAEIIVLLLFESKTAGRSTSWTICNWEKREIYANSFSQKEPDHT
ncbi:hypothetical protein L6164_013806 [Bauhinia variegata]|uniref:Uncharacterized protein n=1 Tax=Bauhinia variegata TaxID=167791 RepID=A0ACB9NGS5_BAUVA|nr:hypothetical protein L6164_013806 [Bauhinia variegata]